MPTTCGAPALAKHVAAAQRGRRAAARRRRRGRSSARRTRRSTPATSRPTTRSTAPRTTPGIRRACRAARAAARRRRVAAGFTPPRARQRHRRLDPQPGALLRRVRPQAELRDRLGARPHPGPARRCSRRPISTCSGRWRAAPRISSSALAVLAGAARRGRRRLARRAAARRAASALAEFRVARRGSTSPAGPPLARRGRRRCSRAPSTRIAAAGARVDAAARARVRRRGEPPRLPAAALRA